eukprot:95605-Hanusia_phi.AAC.1
MPRRYDLKDQTTLAYIKSLLGARVREEGPRTQFYPHTRCEFPMARSQPHDCLVQSSIDQKENTLSNSRRSVSRSRKVMVPTHAQAIVDRNYSPWPQVLLTFPSPRSSLSVPGRQGGRCFSLRCSGSSLGSCSKTKVV